jgi:hypothetical protein
MMRNIPPLVRKFAGWPGSCVSGQVLPLACKRQDPFAADSEGSIYISCHEAVGEQIVILSPEFPAVNHH